MKVDAIRPVFVELIPRDLDQGVLYVSDKFKTAVHLCCCGCGSKVVTPLNAAGWNIVTRGDRVTMTPSIGNWSACKTHYWIRDNHVEWAGGMTDAQIARVRAADARAINTMFTARPPSLIERFWRWISNRL